METLNLIHHKDGSPMTEDDELALLPYASMIHYFSELLTSSDNIAVIDKVKRRDQDHMSEEDENALLPYGGLILLFDLMLPVCDEECMFLTEDDLFSDFDRVARKDGLPISEEEENALLPYSGMITLFSMLSSADLDLHECPTGSFDDDDIPLDVCEGIVRKDGTAFTCEDNNFLMEYGALLLILKAFIEIKKSLPLSADPFEEIERYDGRELDADDDAVLLEYYPSFKIASSIYESMCAPLSVVFYPDGDEDLTEFGEQLGTYVEPITPDDTEISYSAWSLIGRGVLAVYHKTFGSFNSPWKDQNNKANVTSSGLKRKPSGAELTAWIGLATQKTFGLDDPTRKVHARAVL
mmetsp:Transcript_3765/g.4977  ORF Transcript_3765/g.4977 Transcript_3765/m.4977 type:complete len:352 (-) Transcript_3765:235-1290(-)